MKLSLKIFIRTILVFIAWSFCIYKIYIDFDHSYWFDDLIHTSLIVFASIISIAFIYVDYKRYKHQKKLSSFISTAATTICIAALITTTNRLKQQDKTPTILYASKFYSGLNTISIDFRANGTYKCGRSNFMGDSYFKRGSYSINDSIIYLDNSNLYNLVTSDKLLMKTISKNDRAQKKNILSLLFGVSKPDTLAETFLYQLNNERDIISSAIVLRVNKDILMVRQ